MNLVHLKYFIEIYDTQSITVAAKKLFITQPTLSQALKKFEESFNVPLFYRVNNHYVLTEYGRIVYDHGKQVLNTVDTILNEVEQLHYNHQKKMLRIGMNALFYKQFLNQITQFATQHEHVQLNFIQDGSISIQRLLSQNLLDIGIVSLPNYYPDTINVEALEDTTYKEYHVHLVVPKTHELATKDFVTFNDIQSHRIATLNDNFIMRKKLIKLSNEHQSTLNIIATFGSIQSLLQSIPQMNTITFLPVEYNDIYHYDELKWIPFIDKYNCFSIGIATNNNAILSPEMMTFIQTIKQN